MILGSFGLELRKYKQMFYFDRFSRFCLAEVLWAKKWSNYTCQKTKLQATSAAIHCNAEHPRDSVSCHVISLRSRRWFGGRLEAILGRYTEFEVKKHENGEFFKGSVRNPRVTLGRCNCVSLESSECAHTSRYAYCP